MLTNNSKVLGLTLFALYVVSFGYLPFFWCLFLRLVGSLLSLCNHRLKSRGSWSFYRYYVVVVFFRVILSLIYVLLLLLLLLLFFVFFFCCCFFFSYLLFLSIRWDRFLVLWLLGSFTYKASSWLSIDTICDYVTNAPEVISNFWLKYFWTHTFPDNIEAGKNWNTVLAEPQLANRVRFQIQTDIIIEVIPTPWASSTDDSHYITT